jgi:hypothetical protein
VVSSKTTAGPLLFEFLRLLSRGRQVGPSDIRTGQSTSRVIGLMSFIHVVLNTQISTTRSHDDRLRQSPRAEPACLLIPRGCFYFLGCTSVMLHDAACLRAHQWTAEEDFGSAWTAQGIGQLDSRICGSGAAGSALDSCTVMWGQSMRRGEATEVTGRPFYSCSRQHPVPTAQHPVPTAQDPSPASCPPPLLRSWSPPLP